MDLPPGQAAVFAASFREYGLPSLASDVSAYIKQKSTTETSKSWTNAAKYVEIGSTMDLLSYYLGCIHPKVLAAFIEGKATMLRRRDADIALALRDQHKLGTEPLVYINVICRRDQEGVYSTQPLARPPVVSPHAGCSLTINELERVLNEMSLYCDLNANPPATDIQAIDAAIDCSWDSAVADPQKFISGRRFLPSWRAVTVIERWIEKVEALVIQPAKQLYSNQPSKLDEPLTWCFQELGFGVRGASRAYQHATHTGTNYLFGLYHATVTVLFPNGFELEQFRWSLVAEPAHADFVEVLGSVLNGTYGHDWNGVSQGIGLNPTYAGGAHMTGEFAITSDRNWICFLTAQRRLHGLYQMNFRRHGNLTNDKLDAAYELRDGYAKALEELEAVKGELKSLEDAALKELEDVLDECLAEDYPSSQSLLGKRKRDCES